MRTKGKFLKHLRQVVGSLSIFALLIHPAAAQISGFGITNDISGISVFWPAADAGYMLQWTASLVPPVSWQPYATIPVVVGSNLVVSLPAIYPQAFFQLVSTLTSQSGPPAVVTLAADPVYTFSAAFNGTVLPNGLDTTYWFEWGLDTSYGETTSTNEVDGTNTNAVSVESDLIGPLTGGTIYHYQLFASNSNGISSGGDLTFTTATPLPDATVVTFAASSVATSSALLNGSVNPNGSVLVGFFQWGASTSYGNTTPNFYNTSENYSTVAESAALSGLAPNATYHYRVVAYNSGPDEAVGNDVTFTTGSDQPPPPTVVTLAATSINGTCATFNGTVNPNETATTYFFEYGTNSGYGISPGSNPAGSGDSTASFSSTVCGLTPETTYHYQLVAGNSGGASLGGDASFTTGAGPPPPPTVETLAASAITSSAATLNANVNPNGADTYAFFQYGTSTRYDYSSSNNLVSADSPAVDLNFRPLLASSTTYHYRIVAYNNAGTNYGADVILTTSVARTCTMSVYCPSNIVIRAFGPTNIFFSVYASDSCGGTPSIYSYPPSGSSFPLGTTTVYSTAMDGYSSNNCSFNITVVQPTCTMSVYCPSNIVIRAFGPTNIFFSVYASDSCGGTPSIYSYPTSGSSFPLGTTTVYSTAMDGYSSNNCSFNVTVVQPTCTMSVYCPSNIVIRAFGPTNIFFSVYASDSCGFTPSIYSYPTSGSSFPLGTTTVYSTAMDGYSSNNCSFNVTVVQPTCTMSVYCPSNIVVSAPGPTNIFFSVYASDSCGFTPSIYSYPPSGSSFPLGTTTVYSTAMDGYSSNNCSFTVDVLYHAPPAPGLRLRPVVSQP